MQIGIRWLSILVLVQQEFRRCLGLWEQTCLMFHVCCVRKAWMLWSTRLSVGVQSRRLRQELAEKLGAAARENDVRLSLHGSYFINLSGKRDVVEASKRRLIASATAADWMGAYVMVFHTGFYGRFEKDFAFKTCLNALKEVSAEMKSLGLRVKLGPETMGRKFQVGTLDEILTLNQEVEGTQLVVDWAHLHALHQGALKKTEDFRAIAEKIEQKLGTEALKSMHCHFSKIEFTAQGEKRHHTLDEERYGPDFRMLAEVIADFQMHPTMICESPILRR